jgi:hypothetical protein
MNRNVPVKLNWKASNMKKIEHESIESDPRSDFATTSSGVFFTGRTPLYPALVIVISIPRFLGDGVTPVQVLWSG